MSILIMLGQAWLRKSVSLAGLWPISRRWPATQPCCSGLHKHEVFVYIFFISESSTFGILQKINRLKLYSINVDILRWKLVARLGATKCCDCILLLSAVRAFCIGKRKVGVAGGCGCGSRTERDCVVIVWLFVEKGEILVNFSLNGQQRGRQWRRSGHRHRKWRE